MALSAELAVNVRTGGIRLQIGGGQNRRKGFYRPGMGTTGR
jgi:hypothetical protein